MFEERKQVALKILCAMLSTDSILFEAPPKRKAHYINQAFNWADAFLDINHEYQLKNGPQFGDPAPGMQRD